MSELIVSNVFFVSDKSTGIVGGATGNTFSFKVNGSDKLIVNSSSLSFNTAFSVTSLSANGSNGSAGQFLASNGSGIYWTSNITATYTYTANVILTSANLVINTNAGIVANGSVGSSGQALLSNGSSAYWGTAGITTGKAIAMAIVFGG